METNPIKRYRKWSTANIRRRLREDRKTLKWWEAKQPYHPASMKERYLAIQQYSEDIKAMETILAGRGKGHKRAA